MTVPHAPLPPLSPSRLDPSAAPGSSGLDQPAPARPGGPDQPASANSNGLDPSAAPSPGGLDQSAAPITGGPNPPAPRPLSAAALPARERVGPWPADHPRIIGLGPSLPRRGNAFSQWLGLSLLRLLGWRIRGHWPDLPKAVVIVAPHTSNWDGILSVIAILALRLRLSFFMKHSAFPWPFAGLLRWIGAIPVNRDAAHDLVSASAQQFTQRKQLLVAITPDGTRHAPEQWKKGFYWIAHRARVPILCVGYDYAKREIVILEALTPSGDFNADLPRLLEQFRGIAPRHADRLSTPLRGVNRRH